MSDIFRQLKHARLFGHPIHSMLVHFPSALFPISLVFDVLANWLQNSCLACAGFYSIAAGLLFGFVAVIAGAVDYARLPPSHVAWNKASLHALLSISWLIVFGIIFGIRCKHFPTTVFATNLELILALAAVIGLVFSNFLGGDLIFKHKIGFDEQQ